MVVALLLGTATPPTLRHFKEDHLSGANYLRLSSTGEYDVVGREHMGVWTLDEGMWSAKDDTWTFRSAKAKSAPFSCRVVRLRTRTFLVWSGKGAPGIEISEEKVRGDLREDSRVTPPYVCFEIPQDAFERETEKHYPFKFHPEMNREQ
jgi:hypothetical protein